MTPYRRVLLVLGALALAGLGGMAVAWNGADDLSAVALQLPYAVSGALGGLAVLGFALALISIQASRRAAAEEREQFGRFVTASAELLAHVRGGAGS
jgi:hypothetical protein